MRTAEQAFRAYYASMSDADLLVTAKNRASFIPVAQAALDEEVKRREVAVQSDVQVEAGYSPTRPAEQPPARQHRAVNAAAATQPDGGTQKQHACASIGATEDQVSMVGTVPERVNKHGAKIEDLAGTGQHDSLGG